MQKNVIALVLCFCVACYTCFFELAFDCSSSQILAQTCVEINRSTKEHLHTCSCSFWSTCIQYEIIVFTMLLQLFIASWKESQRFVDRSGERSIEKMHFMEAKYFRLQRNFYISAFASMLSLYVLTQTKFLNIKQHTLASLFHPSRPYTSKRRISQTTSQENIVIATRR